MDKKKSKQQDVLVIGAGASGMMTAITSFLLPSKYGITSS